MKRKRITKKIDEQLINEEKKVKEEANKVQKAVGALKPEEIRNLIKNKEFTAEGLVITLDQIVVYRKFKENIEKDKNYSCLADDSCGIRFSLAVNDNMLNKFYCREVINRIQKLRKESHIEVTDDIKVFYSNLNSERLTHVCKSMKDDIMKVIKRPFDIYPNEKIEEKLGEYKNHTNQTFEDLGKDSNEHLTLIIYKKN